MNPTLQASRHAAIEAAAYELLAERGFDGTSMLLIAKRAKASNQTLYKWYGDKLGLFARMVETNVSRSREVLLKTLEEPDKALATLEKLGPILLGMVLGERAIVLNRVAASDGTLAGDLRPLVRMNVTVFVEKDGKRVQAKASDYTQVRWTLNTSLAAGASTTVQYIVKIK